ncbi:MAG: Cysteine desulfurase [Parcubacteria group bacterium GW2011_GWC2_39_14]|nr:MAG: Cysteine desulfurase [Parcubacteria group bacterium GW2011_GWC2_39_14]KKR54496.1 MAG: Cysteine desulfurase [Parcubacteria group bacterium GW2011_GWA2_40_23]
MKQIYFDNAATTAVDPKVLEAMLPYFQEHFGNASSLHSYGQTAQGAVDEARDKVANYLKCKSQEIIFTAGATESNNLVIQGIVNYLSQNNKSLHIITSKIEHPSVLEVFRFLEKQKLAEVSYLDVDQFGLISIEKLKKTIKSNTVLVSIMYANNEMGAIQPIQQVGELIKKVRTERGAKSLPLYFHVDAVQGLNYLDCEVDTLGADALSASGHKIHGPKGIGFLYLRAGVKVRPVNYGGHHEYNLRPGTLNVPAIVGLGKAVELVKNYKNKNVIKIKKIKEALINDLKKIDNIRFNGPENGCQLPNIINVSFLKAEGESILMMLDLAGIAISTGSACSSGSLEPSPILTAMGIKPEWSHGSVRVSLSKFNSLPEVKVFVQELKIAIAKLRKMAP